MQKYFKTATLELSDTNFDDVISIKLGIDDNYIRNIGNKTIYTFFTSDNKQANYPNIAATLVNKISQLGDGFNLEIAEDFDSTFLLENILLALTEVNIYKSSYKKPKAYTVNLVNIKESVYKTALAKAEGYHITRMLNHMPFSQINSETMASNLETILDDSRFNVTVYRKQQCEELEMNGVLAVSRGSHYEPAVIKVEYKTTDTPKVGLVGKGIMFDSGGYNTKNGDFASMKTDMAGTGAVVGTLKTLANLDAKVNVVAYLMTADNMINEHAYIPGDIITYSNGTTVEIGNTDAEGRLVLADGLLQIAKDECDTIIDIATLTGNSAASLGKGLAPLYSTSADITNIFTSMNYTSTDNVWPMPMPEEYEELIQGNISDIRNTSSTKHAGSIMAAIFLKQFAPTNANWIHIDMGAMSRKEEFGTPVNGYGVRLLTNFITKYSQNN